MRHLAHYRDLEKIGQGGMGVVYKAADTRLGRSVALKVLPSLMNTDPARRSRFLREARASAKLNHPNIATIFEVGEAPDENGVSDSDILYIAMEYVEGEDLSARLARGPLPLRDSLGYAIQIAEALDVAHRSGVVHRDLKPHNIRIHPDGRIKILDFGLAKVLQEEPAGDESLLLTKEGFIVGTVPYMAPEQVQGSGADSRSDLFAFGVVLYEMIAGRLPFASGNLIDFVRSLTSTEPDPLSYSNPEVSPELERIVDKLLERQVEERYQSADEVCRDLKAVSGSMAKAPLSAVVGDVKPRRLGTKLTRLIKPRYVVGLALVLLILFGLGWVLRQWLSRPPDSGIVRLAITPFVDREGSVANCSGIDRDLEVELIDESGITVVSSTGVAQSEGSPAEASSSPADLLLLGECRQEALVLTLLEAQSRQVLWGDQVKEPRKKDRLSELAYQTARAIEVTQVVRRSALRAGFTADDLKAMNLYNGGLRQLENFSTPEQLGQAIESLAEAARLAPNVPAFRAELSHAYWRRFSRDKNPEDAKDAEVEAEKAIELDPDLPAARIAKARILRGQDQHEAARDELLLVEQQPQSRDLVHRELGLTADELEDYEQALHHYEMAVRLRPGYWRHRNQLGVSLIDVGEYVRAREHLNVARQLAPDGVVTPISNMGVLEYVLGDHQKALDLLESLPYESLPASTMSIVGNLHFEEGRFEESATWFSRASRHEPESFLHWGNLGDARLAMGDTSAADAFEQALALVSRQIGKGLTNQPELIGFQIKYLAKLGQCQTAIEQIQSNFGDLGKDTALQLGTLFQLAEATALCDARYMALRLLEIAEGRGVAEKILSFEEFTELAKDPEFTSLRQPEKKLPQ